MAAEIFWSIKNSRDKAKPKAMDTSMASTVKLLNVALLNSMLSLKRKESAVKQYYQLINNSYN